MPGMAASAIARSSASTLSWIPGSMVSPYSTTSALSPAGRKRGFEGSLTGPMPPSGRESAKPVAGPRQRRANRLRHGDRARRIAMDADAVDPHRDHRAVDGDDGAGLKHGQDPRRGELGIVDHRTRLATGHQIAGRGIGAAG